MIHYMTKAALDRVEHLIANCAPDSHLCASAQLMKRMLHLYLQRAHVVNYLDHMEKLGCKPPNTLEEECIELQLRGFYVAMDFLQMKFPNYVEGFNYKYPGKGRFVIKDFNRLAKELFNMRPKLGVF